jgi:dipeptidyl-peptidase-3
VDDAAVVQLYADAFGDLPLRDKTLAWHLYQAALAGRDIFYDQRYAHNLEMRDVLEAILTHSATVDAATAAEVRRYAKLFWINTGPYNNLTARKFVLGCDRQSFAAAVREAAAAGARFPTRGNESLDAMVARMAPLFFDPDFDPMVTAKTPPQGADILTASANNLYENVTMDDLEGFDERYALNSRLVKRGGGLVEEVYRADGRYGRPIREIVRHLEAAIPFAAPPTAEALRALIRLYRTGEDADREAYDIAWVKDKGSPVDTINGFVEVYLDARSCKGAWEGIVFYVNPEKTAAIDKLAGHAYWFEQRMPWDPKYRKQAARGVSAAAIEVVIETGDAGPVTPVGINLPNGQHVRERYGSKSVSLINVNEAYEQSTPPSFREEFSWNAEEVTRATRWGALASELTTILHEVIGHGSGRVDERLEGNPQAALKEYFSTVEEARADLVALYFLPDRKLVELGLIPGEEHAAIVLTEYEACARRALSQLRRVRTGSHLEEDHMRSRQLIVHWLMANTQALEIRRRDGKTYYVVADVELFRDGVGRLLAEVQRIKGEGDYQSAKGLVEAHAVRFDRTLRDEIVARAERLKLPSYTGFVMPRLSAVADSAGAIIDVAISYPMDLTEQMLEYSTATRALR